ncbi:MAG: DUF1549 and DUF1553 domain-containing protein [Planctomycetota bacterium]
MRTPCGLAAVMLLALAASARASASLASGHGGGTVVRSLVVARWGTWNRGEATVVRSPVPTPRPTTAEAKSPRGRIPLPPAAAQAPQDPPAPTHPIDRHLAAAHARAGITPLPDADRGTLLRRASLDLIGLPPTPAELDAFAADTAPGAFERAVDRLLASPQYGERWATPWLDLARFSDTGGFNFDQTRQVWKYRDWVIDALNRDVPFDRFTILQLAGDLVDGATDADRIATGFHRNTMSNDEGGVDPEEARWDRLLDRASTTATTWLGATLHCAQCHDHKHDPIRQRDFYAMVAFFEGDDEATVELPTLAQRARRETLRQQLAALEQQQPADSKAIAAAKKALAAAPVDTALVLRQKPDAVLTTTLRLRGSFDARGNEVQAGVPEGLGAPWRAELPQNRLGLARWLVEDHRVRVARVHANRLWGELFGRALVATTEDLGTQAPPPDHPELLAWLADEFVRLGWSQKALLRAIVTSAAYRRSAAAPADLRAADPDNLLLARGSRFRLPAEAVRDLQLAASGLLAPAIGGPSVFPLQADVSGSVPTNKADLRWTPSAGADRHRRGLYTFWRRTATFVQFGVFDAPSREQCVARRQRTNTPLQALSALNDPAAWEAAQALGKRMQDADGDERAKMAFGFRLCTSRWPDEAELALLADALAREDAAMRWTLVANALLNLDEAMTR